MPLEAEPSGSPAPAKEPSRTIWEAQAEPPGALRLPATPKGLAGPPAPTAAGESREAAVTPRGHVGRPRRPP